MNTLEVDTKYAVIPIDLQRFPQWIVWKYEEREDETTKVPYRPDGKGKASTIDAETWGTYQAALNAYSAGGYDGIGFVVMSNDDFCGIDLDHCRNPETGVIETWAGDIIKALNSYSEITPSNAGVRIWIKAKLPLGGNRRSNLEMYDNRRYFTVTGNHLPGTPETIEERQNELNELHAKTFPKPAPTNNQNIGNGNCPTNLEDTELLEKAFNAKNGTDFRRLWDGDLSNYDGDNSRADLALCRCLAFWTGNDENRIDRLFRQSALYRQKWEREDYRKLTIIRATENTHDTYQPNIKSQQRTGMLPLFKWRQTVESLPKTEDLIEDILPCQSTDYMIIAGRAGIGKTNLVLGIAFSLATETPWFSHKTRKCRVGYLAFEGPQQKLLMRFDKLLKSFPDPGENLKIARETPFKLAGKGIERFLKLCHEIDVIIVDPIRYLVAGDYTKPEYASAFINTLKQSCVKTHTIPILIHHVRKPDRRLAISPQDLINEVKGAADYVEAAGTVMLFERARQARSKDGRFGSNEDDRILYFAKVKDSPDELNPLKLRLNRETLIYQPVDSKFEDDLEANRAQDNDLG